MKKLLLLLLILLGLSAKTVVAQTCPPGPPQSSYDGTTGGTRLPNGGRQFNFEYAQTAGFDCFERLRVWFPANLYSSTAISPNHTVLDMAYATHGTATFSNVVVPKTGNYTLTVRYAFNFGLFLGTMDRPEGIMVNGSVLTYDMHFPITRSFEDYDYSSMITPLNAGKNTIQFFNVTDHGVARLDTMVVTPSGNGLCSDAPAMPGSLTASATIKGIDLNWTSSTWPSDCKVRYYDLYRATKSGFIPSTRNQIASGLHTTSYVNVTPLCGTTYYYVVQAVDTVGASASKQASAKTQPCR